MKIVFLGTPDFAVPVLEALFASEHTVSLVVTQPDREKGRGQNVAISPVKACALQKGLPVFQPEKIKAEEATARLRTEQADAFVVAAYGQLLSEELLAMPRFGCLNVHASLLPALRGAAPIQWAVLNGDAQSGITIMQMDKGMDTGDILLQKTVDLAADETAESLYQKLSERGGPLLLQALSLA